MSTPTQLAVDEITYVEVEFPTDDEAERAALSAAESSAPSSPEGSPRGGSPEPQMNQGGHGGFVVLGAENQFFGKPAPRMGVEHQVYDRLREGAYPEWDGLAPEPRTAQEVRDELGDQLTPAQSAALDDENYVYLRNKTSGLQNVKMLDTKIGPSTVSYRENRAQQGKTRGEAASKTFRLSIGADLATGSAFRGWRVVAGTDGYQNRLLTGIQSKNILSRFSDDPQVWDQLIDKMQRIRDAAAKSELGLIAASVLTVTGTRDGNLVADGSVIDFAHAIDPKRPFVQSQEGSTEDLTALRNEYRANFLAGMDSLLEFSRGVKAEKERKLAAGSPAPGAGVVAGQQAAASSSAAMQAPAAAKGKGARR